MFLPKDRRVYIEMDYKCNTPFFVNFYKFTPTYASQYGNAFKRARRVEQNLHFLSEHLASHTDATNFSLSFLMFKDSTLEQSELYLDNIRSCMKNSFYRL